MSRRAGWALTIAAIAIFLLLNRAAYKGYFQDDDLDTLGWAGALPASEFLGYLITLRLSPTNFRPVGAFYYHALETAFGLDFPKYVIVLHGLHLLNIWLVWLLARKLGIGPWGAATGAFFFGFHAVLMDAWWKPMYVFDVFCTVSDDVLGGMIQQHKGETATLISTLTTNVRFGRNGGGRRSLSQRRRAGPSVEDSRL